MAVAAAGDAGRRYLRGGLLHEAKLATRSSYSTRLPTACSAAHVKRVGVRCDSLHADDAEAVLSVQLQAYKLQATSTLL